MTDFNSQTNSPEDKLQDNELNIFSSEVLNTANKRMTFRQLGKLITGYKDYTSRIEKQLTHLQEMISADESVVKSIDIGEGITLSIKFNSGVPVIPKDQAFAITVAATRLISLVLESETNNTETHLDRQATPRNSTPLNTIADIQEILNNNIGREEKYEV